MKTFETEKNNIPEGATHYSEEDKRHLFTWFKVGDAVESYNNSTNKWQLVGAHISCLKSKITPIPKPETTEWNGEGLPPVGVECEAVFIEHESKGYGEFLVLGYHSGYVWMEYVGELSNKSKHYTAKVDLVKFRKPESLEEKEKRERLEAAYDLYLSWVSNSYGEPLFCFKAFCDTTDLCTKWLAIVDKTNYRKGE